MQYERKELNSELLLSRRVIISLHNDEDYRGEAAASELIAPSGCVLGNRLID